MGGEIVSFSINSFSYFEVVFSRFENLICFLCFYFSVDQKRLMTLWNRRRSWRFCDNVCQEAIFQTSFFMVLRVQAKLAPFWQRLDNFLATCSRRGFWNSMRLTKEESKSFDRKSNLFLSLLPATPDLSLYFLSIFIFKFKLFE